MIKQLQRKFIAIAMASLLAVMVVVLGCANLANVHQMSHRADNLIATLAENSGRFSDSYPRKPPPTDLHSRRGPELSAETPFETRYFTVGVGEGGTISSVDVSHIAAVSASEAREYAGRVLAAGKDHGYTKTYRYGMGPAAGDKTAERLLIFVDCRVQLETAASFFLNSCGVALISLIVVLALLTVLSRRAIRPVIESLEKQKQFITDAGHEIKTPLAVISANNDVIEMTTGQSEWTISTHNQVNRLNGLVKNLLTLAKMEEGQVATVFQSLQLSEVVRETAWDFVPLAEKRRVELQVEVEPDLVVRGDEAGISRLTAILVDNAVKYGEPDSQIRVTLEKRGKNCYLEVRNTCGSIPEGDLSRLFDRFYRGDSSRSRESGGYGIGLSVAQAIVAAHGGRISARREGAAGGPVGGAAWICFTVEL